MSFYSSIRIFYPGRPPSINLGELRTICDTLRKTFLLEDDLYMMDVNYENSATPSTNIIWDDTNTIGTIVQNLESETPMDHTKQSLVWQQIWPDRSSDTKAIRRADVSLGNLSESTITELAVSNRESTTPSYISPTEMAVSIGPVGIGTLTVDVPEEECYGCLSLSFSGYGYFTWQPLAAYWTTVRQSASIQKALQMCKEISPASPQINLIALKERLGEMFLNQEDYRIGDWIVSVSESG